MFRVNNKDTKTTSITSIWFTPFSSVFIINFKQVITAWVNLLRTHDIICHPAAQISLDSKKCCVTLNCFIGEYYLILGLSEIQCPAFFLWLSWVKFNHNLSLELIRPSLTLMMGHFYCEYSQFISTSNSFSLKARYEKI